MIIDLHVHSVCSSCSVLEPRTIIDLAAKRGLDGVCITDHDTMDIRKHIREGVQDNGLCVLFGMEYTTKQGDFLLFGPVEELPLGLDAQDILPMVNRLGGVAVAAHPFRNWRPVLEDVVSQGLCRTVERINGRNSNEENNQVETWRREYKLSLTGGSDSHTPEEIGTVATRFSTPIRTRFDLVNALRSGLHQPWQPLQTTSTVKHAHEHAVA